MPCEWMQEGQVHVQRLEEELREERRAHAAGLESRDGDVARLSASLAAAENAEQAHSLELEARAKNLEEERTAAAEVRQQYSSRLAALMQQRGEEARLPLRLCPPRLEGAVSVFHGFDSFIFLSSLSFPSFFPRPNSGILSSSTPPLWSRGLPCPWWRVSISSICFAETSWRNSFSFSASGS